MKIWIDDVRPAPDGYAWVKSVNEAKFQIAATDPLYVNETTVSLGGIIYRNSEDKMVIDYSQTMHLNGIELIDIDHDAGDYACDGGDYIKLLDWLEETGRNYPIRIHSMNPVGVENMRRIIQRNGWTEVK